MWGQMCEREVMGREDIRDRMLDKATTRVGTYRHQ